MGPTGRSQMRAAVLYKARDLRVEEVPRPNILPDEVLVRIRAVGVCGSDLHLYEDGCIGTTLMEGPFILGHEATGDVVEIGSAVSKFKAGDRVALESSVPCRACDFCKRGEQNLCPYRHGHGIPNIIPDRSGPNVDGFYAEYGSQSQDYVHLLPDGIDYVEGTMCDPMSCGLQAASEVSIEPGQSVAVIGAGAIGLSALQAAVVRGVSKAIAVDTFDRHLEVARELGATHLVNASRVPSVVDEVVRLAGGFGPDVVIEAVGLPVTMQQSVDAVRRGGSVVLMGVSSQPLVPLDVVKITRSRLKVSGCFAYVNHFPTVLSLAAAGKINLKAAITNTFPLSEAPAALEFASKRKDVAIKCVLTM